MVDKEYEVALSFAGSQRSYVENVARNLESSGVRVFYDGSDDEEIRLWGLDLAEEFHRVYSQASLVVVIFVSQEYADRAWTRHERRSALERALKEKREYILPARFEDVDLPGIQSTLGYLPLTDVKPEEFAKKIERKLVSLGARLPSTGAPTSRWLSDGTKRIPGSLSVFVSKSDGSPVAGVRVGVIRPNGTASYGTTDNSGNVQLNMPGRELVDIHLACIGYSPVLIKSHDSAEDIAVDMINEPGVSGAIFESSTGHLPGLSGRLNPIEDGGRYYVYGDNIAADGMPARPAHFIPGRPMAMEDAAGNRLLVTFLAVVGNHSLIRYEHARDHSVS